MSEMTFAKLEQLEADYSAATAVIKKAGPLSSREQNIKFVRAGVAVGMAMDALKENYSGAVVIENLADPIRKAKVEKLFSENAAAAAEELQKLSSSDEGPWDVLSSEADHYSRPWVSPKETYLRYQLSKPIVSITSLPPALHEMVEEARRCYAMEQTLSVIALGRMILECAMNDIGQRTALFSSEGEADNPFWDYPPSKRADDLFGASGPRRDRFKRLYRQGSEVIHSNHSSTRPDCLTFLNEVLQFVGDRYTVHSRQFRK